MRQILKSKAGVTVLEGVIALGLLALVAGGAFGVLLSASRQTTEPDVHEEMVLAVEKANDQLKAYTMNSYDHTVNDPVLPTGTGSGYRSSNPLSGGLCNTGNPFACTSTNRCDIGCLLPPICDKNNSIFEFYFMMNWPLNSEQDEGTGGKTFGELFTESIEPTAQGYSSVLINRFRFHIVCNGYQL